MTAPSAVRRGPAKWVWLGAGFVCVGVGGVGIAVPGLPTTIFFILAASCFARSSPRFERWVLELPKVGPMVRDHRAGLGMPRRAKAWAVSSMVFAAGISVWLVDAPLFSLAIAALAAVGAWYVAVKVPTKERVVALRSR